MCRVICRAPVVRASVHLIEAGRVQRHAADPACNMIHQPGLPDRPRTKEPGRCSRQLAQRFCVCEKVSANPDLARKSPAGGIRLSENPSHGERSLLLAPWPTGTMNDIGQAQETIAQVVGQPPRFLSRAPGRLRIPCWSRIGLLDLQLASWTLRASNTEPKPVTRCSTKDPTPRRRRYPASARRHAPLTGSGHR